MVRIAKLRNGLERHLTLTGFEPLFVRIDHRPPDLGVRLPQVLSVAPRRRFRGVAAAFAPRAIPTQWARTP